VGALDRLLQARAPRGAPELHQLFWDATKAAGANKKSLDPADGQKLIDLCDQIATVFAETKK
jgi:nickel superoxide dismutase